LAITIFQELRFWKNIATTDKKILVIFILILIIIISIITLNAFINRPPFSESISSILSGIIFNLFGTGILAFKYYRGQGIVPIKYLLRNFLKYSLVFGLIFAIGFQYWIVHETISEDPGEVLEPLDLIFIFIGLYLGGFFLSFFALILLMLLGFGAVAIISAIAKGVTPEILLEISRISEKTTQKMKKKDRMTYWKYYGLQWFFNIPYVLDTKKLKLDKYRTFKKLPWREIESAIYFQILFGTMIVIYISFNPFLLETKVNIFTLFSIAFNVTFLIPFIIIPWFIYYRLGARIKGPVRSFLLYHGIKHRMFRTIVALGTILLLIRLALKEIELKEMVAAFSIYYLIFTVTVALFSIVYFNFFENELAMNITKRYSELKK